MANLFYMPFRPAYDSAGVSIPGAKAYFTLTGTNTASAPFTNSGLTIPHSNPVVADATGKLPIIYLDPAKTYRVRLYSKNATVAVDTPLEEFEPYVPGIFADATALQPVADAAAASATASSTSASAAATSAASAAASGASAATSATAVLAAQMAVEAALATTSFTLAELAAGQPVNVEWFGAVGDGVTDDSAALRSMVAFVNSAGSGTIRFGRGKTYLIGQHITAGNGNALDDFQFLNCDGLVIDLNGSKLDIAGNFDRDASTTQGYSGLYLANCSNVKIFNGEIDGNVDAMTNSSVSLTPSSFGIWLAQCSDVVLENLHVHHFSADGLYLKDNGSNGSTRTACRRIKAVNCRFLYSARQGMSVVQARDCTFEHCSFSFTGRSAGTYGSHSPGAGVDVEPDRSAVTVSPDTMDVNTGNIVFNNCTFEENAGGQFNCGGSLAYDNVKLLSSTINVGAGSTAGGDCSVIGCQGFVLQNCDIDIGQNSKAFYVWPNAANVAGDVLISGNRFTGKGSLMRTNGAPTGQITIQNNSFRANGATAISGTNVIDLASGTDLKFRFNRIFIPKEMYTDGGAGDRHIILTFANVAEAEGNLFTTDLLAAVGSSGTAHYANNYGAATIVRNDTYTGTAVGTSDTFRPVFNSSYDSAIPFNKSIPGWEGIAGTKTRGDVAVTIIPGTDVVTQRWTSALTADRAVTLSTTGAVRGNRFRITRESGATGAFNLNVGTGPLKALGAAGTWSEVYYDGSSWVLTASGTL